MAVAGLTWLHDRSRWGPGGKVTRPGLAPDQVLEVRTQPHPAAAPPGSLRDWKGAQGRCWAGIHSVLEEKQPQIGFQGSESLHPLLPVLSKELRELEPPRGAEAGGCQQGSAGTSKPPGHLQQRVRLTWVETRRGWGSAGDPWALQATPGPARTKPWWSGHGGSTLGSQPRRTKEQARSITRPLRSQNFLNPKLLIFRDTFILCRDPTLFRSPGSHRSDVPAHSHWDPCEVSAANGLQVISPRVG